MLYIYTSGTTGPPKGCSLSHRNYRAITDAVVSQVVLEAGDSGYLFPLAHAFAILIQFATFDSARPWRTGRATRRRSSRPHGGQSSHFPSVPRMFEKIWHVATSAAPDKAMLEKAVDVGVKVRMARRQARTCPRS